MRHNLAQVKILVEKAVAAGAKVVDTIWICPIYPFYQRLNTHIGMNHPGSLSPGSI